MNWVWFLLIGWWAGPIWFTVGVLACLTFVGIPIGMPMIHKTPKIIMGE